MLTTRHLILGLRAANLKSARTPLVVAGSHLVLPEDPRKAAARMASTESNPVETALREKLTAELQPSHLEVINESYMHNVPKEFEGLFSALFGNPRDGDELAGTESHFKVVIVSDKFENQPLIKRHRMVNQTLKLELSECVHALSIVAKTPEQWQSSSQMVDKSPACRGGAGL